MGGEMTSLGFVGTGHLGSMLVRKFVETGAINERDIIASNRDPAKAQQLAAQAGIRIGRNRDVALQSDVIFLCVRPLDVKGVLRELDDSLTAEKLLVSVAVDFSLRDLEALCKARVARVVPSVACEHLLGVTLVAMGNNATLRDKELIFSLFAALGEPVEVPEDHFEVLADITSCGPGYISALLHEFALASSWRGVSRDLAEELVKKTLIGTTRLLEAESFGGLISCVATKGGITEEGVKIIAAEAPDMFSKLFSATRAKHELVKKRIEDQQ